MTCTFETVMLSSCWLRPAQDRDVHTPWGFCVESDRFYRVHGCHWRGQDAWNTGVQFPLANDESDDPALRVRLVDATGQCLLVVSQHELETLFSLTAEPCDVQAHDPGIDEVMCMPGDCVFGGGEDAASTAKHDPIAFAKTLPGFKTKVL